MQTLKDLKANLFEDRGFRRLYDRECHVCATTMRIFEILHRESIPMEAAAEELGVGLDELVLLFEADYCKPAIVERLCRHLDLPLPTDCPRADFKAKT